MNKGVREALRYLEHAIDQAEDMAKDTTEMNIYNVLWTDMANAAARCASDLENKKTALGVGSTENGSKGGHPIADDSLAHNQSVDEKTPSVKIGDGAYIVARSTGGGFGTFQAGGGTIELACGGAAVISGLAVRLPKQLVIAAILSGCDHAGISMDELVATHERGHIR